MSICCGDWNCCRLAIDRFDCGACCFRNTTDSDIFCLGITACEPEDGDEDDVGEVVANGSSLTLTNINRAIIERIKIPYKPT